jgi:hypothetical protein
LRSARRSGFSISRPREQVHFDLRPFSTAISGASKRKFAEGLSGRGNLLPRSELHPKAMEDQMTRQPIFVEDNKKPLKPRADDHSHEPAKHIKETARLSSSVETAKDPSKVQRTKD